MKRIALLPGLGWLALSLSIPVCVRANEDAKTQTTLTVDELNRTTVIGLLGIPLNTLADMEGTVVSCRTHGNSKDDGAYFNLSVEKVNGRPLSAPVRIWFESEAFPSDPLPNDYWQLFEIKNWKKAHGLTEDSMDDLEKNYVGRKYRFRAYETGAYAGTPKGWGRHDGIIPQSTLGSARFRSRLQITAAWVLAPSNPQEAGFRLVPPSRETQSAISASLKRSNSDFLDIYRTARSALELDGHPELKQLCVGKTVSFVELRDMRLDSARDKTKPRRSVLCVYDESTHLRLGETTRDIEGE